MKSNFAAIQELMNEMQALQASQEEETSRLRRRLSWLETRRREFFDIIQTNSGDYDTMHKLEETEKQREEVRDLLAQAESDLKAALMDLRQKLISTRNEELTNLEQERKALAQRKAEIHTELLPEAMARVTALHEEEQLLAQRSEEITRSIRLLNQMELPSTQTQGM